MGLNEVFFILVVALILFGPDDLPVIARAIGRTVRYARKYTSDITREFENAVNDSVLDNKEPRTRTKEEYSDEDIDTYTDTEEDEIVHTAIHEEVYTAIDSYEGDKHYLTYNEEPESNVTSISPKDIFPIITNICTNAVGSSISFDLITNSDEYKQVVNLKEEALSEILLRFNETKADGLEEFIMAMICSEILSETDITFTSGREWFDNYQKSALEVI